MPSRLPVYTYIRAVVDTDDKLAAFLPRVRAATWVAVDTEADSLHAYPEKICLIQISTPNNDQLIDPLAEIDLGPLLQSLSGHELIMHGADYDLRLLRKHHDFVPGAMFDTMLAARLLGLRQFSLSHLVETYLGVKLEKGPQKANWAVRPLTQRMVDYARNDTHYLKPLSDRLRADLEQKGRLGWHREMCIQLIGESQRDRSENRESAWRLKGSNALSRAAMAVLRELWLWREKEAISANKPPFFILSHDLLVDIATAATSGRAIESQLPRHLSDRRRRGLMHAVDFALSLPAEKHPLPVRNSSRRASEAERKRFMEFQKRRDAAAHELDLDPTLIASRGMLSELAQNWEQHSKTLMNWQRVILSKRL